ncbi:MAG TPA: EamA family transporter [Patescibacteria group bacterium]|nr:EamA family transporter [Patescibacteria group bacterium]
MEIWVLIAITAYLMFAFKGVLDKFLLSKEIRHARVFAFYVGITAPLVFVLAPFGFEFLSSWDTFIALLGGMCFTYALYFFYHAIKESTISRILPISGGLVPICTLVLAYLFVDERLSGIQYLAFILLVVGAVLISFKRGRDGWHARGLVSALIASLLFAASHTATKYIFGVTSFTSTLIWTRLGIFIGALTFLATKTNRRLIFRTPKAASKGSATLFYFAHAIGALAGLLQNFSFKLGPVSIVSALQGIQDVFLLCLTSFLSVRYPEILHEKITGKILAQKVLAIIIITVGLYLVSYA